MPSTTSPSAMLNKARSPLLATGALWLLVAAGPAHAQQAADDRLAPLRACAAIADPAQRLACYDREAGVVVAAVNTGDVRLVERREVEQTRRSLFGFTVPRLGIFGDDEEAPDTLETTITGVRSLGQDAWAIQVAEGSVWQITNAPSRLRTPKAGDAIVIKKAALGSFFIRIAGQTGVKGRRVS